MNTYSKLLALLADLKAHSLSYTLEHNREDAIMVIVATPTERWEINFFANGAVETERFKSIGFSEDDNGNLSSLFTD